MSTRCTINFCYGKYIAAKVYRHSDGYPDTEHGVLAALQEFFAAVEEQCGNDTRFADPTYLAAKFVVWQAGHRSRGGKPLNFLGVGILLDDPGDIEYTYFVDCSSASRPTVTHKALHTQGAESW